jgi:hypothetical protein
MSRWRKKSGSSRRVPKVLDWEMRSIDGAHCGIRVERMLRLDERAKVSPKVR